MGFFVGDHVAHADGVHIFGQIDARSDEPENEGGGNRFACVNIVAKMPGIPYAPHHTDITDEHIHKHCRHAGQPDAVHHKDRADSAVDFDRRLHHLIIVDDVLDDLGINLDPICRNAVKKRIFFGIERVLRDPLGLRH